MEEARRILKSFEDCVPGLAMVRLRRVSLERRQGNMEGAEALLMEAIRDNEGMPVSSFYSVKLARQVLKVQKNLIKARKILLEALEKDPVRNGGWVGNAFFIWLAKYKGVTGLWTSETGLVFKLCLFCRLAQPFTVLGMRKLEFASGNCD